MAFVIAANGQAGWLAWYAARRDLLQIGDGADRPAAEFFDRVTGLEASAIAWRTLADGADVCPRAVFGIGDFESQAGGAAVARGHTLQPGQVKADDRFLIVGDDGHTHLAGALDHLLGRLTIYRNITDVELDVLLAKEVLRLDTPRSGGCGVNGYARSVSHR